VSTIPETEPFEIDPQLRRAGLAQCCATRGRVQMRGMSTLRRGREDNLGPRRVPLIR